ncbi:MAG: DUF58 domain-containing protein [Burkholderiaceae bacterium]
MNGPTRLGAVAGPRSPGQAVIDAIDRWSSRLPSQRRRQHGERVLSQRSIYILPSRPGLLYGTVLAAMLIAAINYRLSLGYALTFLLAGMAIAGMLHTFRNLTRLQLRPGRAEPVFAGQIAEFTLQITNPTRFARYAIHVQAPGMAKDEVFDLAPHAERIGSVALPTTRRGWQDIPRLTLRTRFPLGIWTAWAYWLPAMRVLVYPTPENPPTPLPDHHDARGDGDSRGSGQEDVAGIRPYQPGDPPKRIAWKAIARTGGDHLLSKHLEGGARGDLALDWSALPVSLDAEARLSRLTRWVIDADAQGARFSLHLPGVSLPAASGGEHRQACLQALAEAEV